MKRIVSISLSIFIFLCVVVASERRAFGYVDPGQGLIALQSLAAVAAAFGYSMRRRIRMMFSKTPAPEASKENNSTNAA